MPVQDELLFTAEPLLTLVSTIMFIPLPPLQWTRDPTGGTIAKQVRPDLSRTENASSNRRRQRNYQQKQETSG